MRDLRSNDRIQRDLMGQVEAKYGDRFTYLIKQGQDRGQGDVLDNQTAAQLITAIWREEPWNAVRKVRLFDDDYYVVFRSDIDADKLFLAFLIDQATVAVRHTLDPELQSSFSSIRFTLCYLIAHSLAMSDEGQRLLADPGQWLPQKEDEVKDSLGAIAEEVAESVNFHVKSEREDEKPDQPFDPKTAFKSQKGVSRVDHDVTRDLKRQARRDPAVMFSVEPIPQAQTACANVKAKDEEGGQSDRQVAPPASFRRVDGYDSRARVVSASLHMAIACHRNWRSVGSLRDRV